MRSEEMELQAKAKRGVVVMVTGRGQAWCYSDGGAPVEPFELLVLDGKGNDGRLLSTGLIQLFVGEPVKCKATGCKRSFASPEAARVHHRRAHEPAPPGPRPAP